MNAFDLIGVSLLFIVFLYINGLFLNLLTKDFKIKLKNYFHISTASSFLNLVIPFRGGAVFRAWYMKKKYNFNYSYFLSSLFGNYVVIFFISTFLGLIVTYLLYCLHGEFNLIVFISFIAVFLIMLTLFLVPGYQFNFQNIIFKKINEILKGWKIISKNKILISQLIILQIANLLVSSLELWIIFRSFNIDISLIEILFISILSVLSLLFNITPGSLGVTESFYVFSGLIINVPPDIMLLVALTKRAIETTILFILGPISKLLLLRDLNDDIVVTK